MFILEQKNQTKTLNRRAFFLLLTKISFFSIIGWRLFDIQIFNSSKYKTLSKNNQINFEILYPVRGEIKDRKGNLVATNKIVYDLYIVPEQTLNISNTLSALNNFVNIDFKKKRKVIELSKKVKKFESIKVLENLSWKELEIIEANKNHLSGLYLQENYQRIYPQKRYFSHILGYINQPDVKDLNLPYISKMPKLDIGKIGIEKHLNENLVGKAGQREIEVNSSGRVIREITRISSQKGKNVDLTIDDNLQKFTHIELENHRAGSIVVLNTKTGEILSMASHPSYDPNLILKKPNADYWQSLMENQLSPFTHRSIQGLYSPGSTFKMVVALAGLKHNLINPNNTQFCEGKIEYGDRFYHCWKTRGHGTINLETAIKESCDVFFYKLALKVGIERIAKIAKEFGLGQKFNIGFDNEQRGIVPTKEMETTK